MTFKTIAMAAVLSLAATAASAVTQSFGPTANDFTEVLTFDQFNGPGVLSSVDITIDITGFAEVTGTNGGQFESVNTFGGSSTATVSTAGLGVVATEVENASTVQTLAPGATFAGTLMADIFTTTVTLTGADLAEFIGAGTIDLTVISVGATNFSGGASTIVDIATLASGEVTVDYNVDGVVPLPGSLSLLLGALGAVGVIASRRKAA